MEHEFEAKWTDGMSFEADVNDHTMVVDAAEKVGGKNKGPRPKPLLLFSLAGCTGMDVVSLLKKMRVDYDDFRIRVSGEVTDDHPKYYKKIHLIYQFKGNDLDKGKVEKAVNMSQEKYCGVSYMLKQAAEVTYEIQYQ